MNMDVKKHHNVIFAFVLGILLVASSFPINCCGYDKREYAMWQCNEEIKKTVALQKQYDTLQKQYDNLLCNEEINKTVALQKQYDTLQKQYDNLLSILPSSGAQQSQALVNAQQAYRELEQRYLTLQREVTRVEQDVLAKKIVFNQINRNLEIANSQAETLRANQKKIIENTELLLNGLNTDMAMENISTITDIPTGIAQVNQKYAQLKQIVGEQPFIWYKLDNNNQATLIANIDTNIEHLLSYINNNEEYFVNHPYKKTLAYLPVLWYLQLSNIPAKNIGWEEVDWQTSLAKLQTSSAKILIREIQKESQDTPANPQPPSNKNAAHQPNLTNPPTEPQVAKPDLISSPAEPQVAKPAGEIIQPYQKVWEEQIMANRKQYHLALRLYQELLQLKCLVLAKK